MPTIETRTSPNGTVWYHVKVRLKGLPAAYGHFSTYKKAYRWGHETEAALRDGRYLKTAEAKRHTLAEAVNRYIVEVLPSKPANAPTQETQLLRWRKRIGHLTLADVTPAVIATERDALLGENIGTAGKPRKRSPATVVRHMAVLSHLFTVALREWAWVDDSPVRKVRKPKEPRGRVRVLDDDERKRLFAACHESRAAYLYAIVVLAISTGMRRGEILTLTKGQVDLGKGRISLHRTKNGERRTVPLAGRALELLRPLVEARGAGDALLFPGPDPRKPVGLNSAWDKALERAEIRDLRFHDLRHCAASYLLADGASLGQIAEVLGHKTLAMVKRYSHLQEPESARIVGAMNARIFQAP
jgi:integrase